MLPQMTAGSFLYASGTMEGRRGSLKGAGTKRVGDWMISSLGGSEKEDHCSISKVCYLDAQKQGVGLA